MLCMNVTNTHCCMYVYMTLCILTTVYWYQVVLWDMTHALSTLDRRSSKKQKQSSLSTSSTTTATAAATTQANGGSAEPLQEHEDDTSTSGSTSSGNCSKKGGCEYVAPTVVSHIDLGHRQVVE
jgi:hypothetical protein